jgi:SAM-dependent methyltransferase
MNASSQLTGFDAAAARYDADEADNPVLLHMRARAFRHLTAAFARGSSLVELGSGTGTEAARLVRERGCRVALVDPSVELLDVASAKVRGARADGLIGRHPIPARSVASLLSSYQPGSFDGAYSSFGALNCEPSLHPVADGLAQLLRPNGVIVLSIINRWCPQEFGWYALHGQWREATRRWGGPVQAAAYPGGPKDVRTFYYSQREIERAFAAAFTLEHAEALPVLLPPPYLDFLVRRFRRMSALVASIDEAASRLPLLRRLGDHVLVRMRRR